MRNILGRLNASLHYERRPRGPEKRAAIAAVARPLSELRLALSKLDPDTRELLLAAAEHDPWDQDTEPVRDGWLPGRGGGQWDRGLWDAARWDTHPPGGLAGVRVDRARDGVESLARWVPRVEEAIGKSRGGRPKQEAIQQAVNELRDIWTRFGPRRIGGSKNKADREPTLSYGGRAKETRAPFIDFCRAALAPLFEKLGIEVDLEHAIRKALYG